MNSSTEEREFPPSFENAARLFTVHNDDNSIPDDEILKIARWAGSELDEISIRNRGECHSLRSKFLPKRFLDSLNDPMRFQLARIAIMLFICMANGSSAVEITEIVAKTISGFASAIEKARDRALQGEFDDESD